MPKLKKFYSAANKRDALFGFFLLAPTIAVLLALSIYPLAYSISVSLKTEDGWSLNNFARLSSDSFFLSALLHTMIFATAALIFEFSIGLSLALLLNGQLKGRGLFRASLLAPMMLPTVVVGVVWRLMLNPNFGAINGTLKRFGMDTERLTWTASPRFRADTESEVWVKFSMEHAHFFDAVSGARIRVTLG